MKEQMEIQPIINGSVNPNLTQELFNELHFESKRRVIWNIMVSMGHAHCFPGVDYRCYEKPDEEFLYSPIAEENADELFSTMREKFKAHHRMMLAKTKDLHYDMGQRIHSAQKELGFGGYVQLDAYRLRGYIDAGGSWNEFKSGVVGAAVSKMDSLAPRKDYGVNNPNSGMSMHQWKVVHSCEYVILSYEFIDKKDLERVQAFYTEHWEPKGRSIKADSVRMEINELDGNYYTVELIWWWD
jgi:hypothetical protein